MSESLTVAIHASSLVLILASCGGAGPEGAAQSVMDGDPPALRSWVGAMDCCGEDAHPVHGAARPDGSVVMVGKSLGDGRQTRGFVTRWMPVDDDPVGRFVDGDTQVIAATRILEGDSALLQVVDAGEVVVVVGFEADSATADATAIALALDPDTLETRARLELTAPEAGRSAVFESAALHEDGRLVLGGSQNVAREQMEGFKSYGNVFGGEGLVVELDIDSWLAASTGGSAVSAQQAGASTRAIPEIYSAKSLRTAPDGSVFAVASDTEEISGLLAVTPSLASHDWTAWEDGVELTDLQWLTRGGQPDAIALVGHGGPESIDGQARLLDVEGNTAWTRSVGNPGLDAEDLPEGELAPDKFIFDECWGAAQSGELLVMACGTGIEGCDEVEATAAEREACRNDPRLRWRTWLVALDAQGEVAWSRADSFVDESGEVHESAAEFVVVDPAGTIHVVVDHAFGVGLMRLGG